MGSLPVLRDVSLEMHPGEAAAIMGPSGSGKTTLLSILGTLERPARGSILIDGVDPFSLPGPELAAFRNRKIGFVFQDHCLLPQCSVLENVLLPTLAGERDEGAVDRARALLERVGLSARLDHRPAELSGGEKQRVAIARALIRRPLLLLCDEPTGNLDPKTASTVAQVLLELHRQLSTILVVVTHSIPLAGILPRRYELEDGILRPTPGSRFQSENRFV